MDRKERYLKNPHITLDDKRIYQLGITTEDIERAGAAVELPEDEPLTTKEVVIRKKNARNPQTSVSGNTLSKDYS